MTDNTTTQTTPGVMPTVTNKDGSEINSGGAVGKLAPPAIAVAPVSYTAPVVPPSTDTK